MAPREREDPGRAPELAAPVSDALECPGCDDGGLLEEGRAETTSLGALPCPLGFGWHDRNRLTVVLICSRGHRVLLKGALQRCPCGWTPTS